jgi:DNA-directed RNA polymerase specialized sigma subunit
MSNKKLKTEPIKKKIGRPFQEVKRDVMHNVKFTPNESLKLNEMAQKQGVSKSEVIRIKLFK